MRHNGFVAFILTHGRPDRVLTYEKLRKHGYTGKNIRKNIWKAFGK